MPVMKIYGPVHTIGLVREYRAYGLEIYAQTPEYLKGEDQIFDPYTCEN